MISFIKVKKAIRTYQALFDCSHLCIYYLLLVLQSYHTFFFLVWTTKSKYFLKVDLNKNTGYSMVSNIECAFAAVQFL